MQRKTFVRACLIAAIAVPPWTAPSQAQTWPQRTVRIIVPVPSGSSPDVAARLFAERLAVRWGRPVIVEDRPGADGLIGTADFAALHDDHVLLFAPAAPLSVYPVIKDRLSYVPDRDVLPISTVAETFGTISTSASLPAKTLTELFDYARARPGRLNWASGGGAFPIVIAGFLKSAGLAMVEVPYRNQAQALQDTAEGRLQMMLTPMTPTLPFVQAGKLRALAVTNSARSPLWPDVPTATEAGFPGLTFEGLLGVFGPRDTPRDRLARISADIGAIAAQPDIASRLAVTGQIVRASTPAEFSAAIEAQRAKIKSIVRFIDRPND
jgi:tripartite-type tricarboxylate transporter receptor subunit TctC